MADGSRIAQEQRAVDVAYGLLDEQIDRLLERLGKLASDPSVGTPQDRLERQAHLDNLSHQLVSSRAAQTRLAFGRIDREDGASHHVGRIGLRDDAGEPVLLDWRAPNAAPFYQATTAEPLGIRSRSRIITRDRTVTHVEDEDLADPTSTATDAAARSVEAPREGRMHDIIATIAADQDVIIRSPLNQVTVVEGGPGTGKTVVALHRAAWLLYTHRDKLARDGVLVVGPSEVFLHYIDQVLPSLGETDVVLVTPGQLYPGISARLIDSPAAARVKGDLRMIRVVANAVQQRIRIPLTDVVIDLDDNTRARISAAQLQDARRAVPKRASFHDGREPFLRRALEHLARNRAQALGWDDRDEDVRSQLVSDLAERREIRRALNLMWLPVSPERLVRTLLSDPQMLTDAAAGILSNAEQRAILRAPDAPWAVDDIPLLDEAAERLGAWVDPAHARAERHAARAAEGELQLAGFGVYESDDRGKLSVAERALAERTWVYGHVVVDEAQDLSRMAWHILHRRATRLSMTVVGDLQQAAHPAAARDWQEALDWAKSRIVVHPLRITYRITRQIADAATALLVGAGGQAPDLHPVREGEPVRELPVSREGLIAMLVELAAGIDGRCAVIVPDASADAITAALLAANDTFGAGDEALDAPVAVITARQSKGLEFDQVIVADVDAIVGQSARGADAYVAATRATQRLTLIHVHD